MSKRKMDPTFAASEKMALIELVKLHYNIVECKKTDTVSLKQKTEEWHKIADEFNAISSIHPRDWVILKNCWENLKKRAKQEQTSRNQHFLGTGGGPPKKVNNDPATERVLELIHTRVTGYVNCFDSDGFHVLASTSKANEAEPSQDTSASMEVCVNDSNIIGSQVLQSLVVDDNEPNANTEAATTLTVDWSQYTPNMLREMRNPALARSKSPTPEVQDYVDQQETQQAPMTPPSTHTAHVMAPMASTSRRRPALRRNREIQNLNKERVSTLINANMQAVQEHELNMKILRLREENEREILQQEKLKTNQEKIKLEILELELRKLKE